MKVYLMRHGETDYNKKGLIQGTLDIPLNEFGLELAEKTKEGFEKEGLTFDYCYCSPLIRARQTAEIILRGTDTPLSYDERIREMNFGEGEGQKLADLSWNRPLKILMLYFMHRNSIVPRNRAKATKRYLPGWKTF